MQSKDNCYYDTHNVDISYYPSPLVITSLYLCLYIAVKKTGSFLPSNCFLGDQLCAKEAEWPEKLNGLGIPLMSNVTCAFVLLRCMPLNVECVGHHSKLFLSHKVELFLGIRVDFCNMV